MKLVAVSRESPSNNEIYAEAARRIKEGRLVAFPTETVYGLGGNGLDVNAVKLIYEMKRRPASDPVILHVTAIDQAWPLWSIGSEARRQISALQSNFWPGPLTIIAPAASHVPSAVTANTMNVAVRNPSHPVARLLIDAAGVPIAAPSANLFSRISPTKAEHVVKYFKDSDVLILECDDCCSIGIESTVIQITEDGIRVLRNGAITASQLRESLKREGIICSVLDRQVFTNPQSSDALTSSPGQSIIHYAPKMDTFLAIGDRVFHPSIGALAESAMIDLSGHCLSIKDKCLAYYDLSGDRGECAARSLFKTFHEIEDQYVGKRLLLCISEEDSMREEYSGLLDRCLRAAAHRFI